MIQTNAFVLGSRPQGEADRVYTLFTEEFGKIEAFAKSVRKPDAKLAGHLEPPNYSWVMLAETNRSSWNGDGNGWQITQALEEESYAAIREDAAKLRSVLRGAEIVHEFLPPAAPAGEVWSLWKEWLGHLAAPAADPEFLFAQFAARALAHFGFFPEITSHPELPRRAKQVLGVIMKGVWLPQSSESREVVLFVGGALVEGRKHMI